MQRIREPAAGQIDQVVALVREHWEEISRCPGTSEAELEPAFWERRQREGRILICYEGHDRPVAMLNLTKEGTTARFSHVLVVPSRRGCGTGTRMLRLAEKMAGVWGAESISLLLQEEQQELLRYFHRLGYVLHCPIGKKGYISLEKKLVL